MPITASDIAQVVAQSDDFGFEMRVGTKLRSISALTVHHGGTYVDSVTSKPRQFDYRCFYQRDYVRLALAVECKNIKVEEPLVISGTERKQEEAFHHLIRSANRNVISSYSKTIPAEGRYTYYGAGDFVGKTLMRVKESKDPKLKGTFVAAPDEDVYERLAQAVSSGIELAEDACLYVRDGELVFTAVIPIVVLPNNSLWRVPYDQSGNAATPESVLQCDYFIARPIELGKYENPQHNHAFRFSHVHFVTIDALESFVSTLFRADLYITGWLRSKGWIP
jgi:hypothetical protein